MQANKKKLWILLLALIVIAAIIIIAIAQSKKTVKNPVVNNPGTEQTNNTSTPPDQNSTTTVALDSVGTVVSSQALKDAQVVVPGANPITKDNKVITAEGKVVDNTAVPNTAAAPHQTEPIASVASLPDQVYKISVSAAGISPKTFTVQPGAAVTVAFSAVDDSPHTIMFDDSALSAVAAGLGPRVTRAISFNAPVKTGSYTFRCGFPNHAERGEVGTMIVK